jgi:hypothetical protein
MHRFSIRGPLLALLFESQAEPASVHFSSESSIFDNRLLGEYGLDHTFVNPKSELDTRGAAVSSSLSSPLRWRTGYAFSRLGKVGDPRSHHSQEALTWT